MLKGLALIAVFMAISADDRQAAIRTASPIAVVFQFRNVVATIARKSLMPGSSWSEELPGNGSFVQGRITGPFQGTGGSFLIKYNSGDVFNVTAVFGGGVINNCTVVKQQDVTSRVTMKARSQVRGRVMTCSLNSNIMDNINPTHSEPNTQSSVPTGRVHATQLY